ncbi:hypothetical protein [Aliterella atlantica]|nr:hypothetical protein [Aliterella atlantica]
MTLNSDRLVQPVCRGITLAPAEGKWLVATGKKQKTMQLVNQL